MGDVFDCVEAVVQAECQVEGDDEAQVRRMKVYGLQALNTVLDTLLSEAARYRSEAAALHPLPPSSTPGLQWTFRPAVRQALAFHCQFVGRTIVAITPASSLHTLRIDLFQFLLRIARSLLLDYAAYTHTSRADTATLAEYTERRAELILLLRGCLPRDQGSRVDVVYELAAEFQEFAAIIAMAEEEGEEEERERRLQHYLQLFGEPFARVLFHSYYAQQRASRLFRLHQPAEYEGWLLSFLSQHPELEWMQQTAMGQWEEAGSTLMDVTAQGEGEAGDAWTWSHQKTLWSMSKLALLCAADTPSTTTAASLVLVNDALDVSTAQAYAAQGDPSRPLLPHTELVHTLLSLPHVGVGEKGKGKSHRGVGVETDMDGEMTPFLLAVEVYHKGVFPWSSGAAGGVMSGEELLLLERLWLSVYDKDRAVLRELSEQRRREVSDAWLMEVRRTRLYALWFHLVAYDWYGKRSRFEVSFEHFVKGDAWIKGGDSQIEVQRLRSTMQAVHEAATQ